MSVQNIPKMPLATFTSIYSHLHSKIPGFNVTDWLDVPYEAHVISSDHIMEGQYAGIQIDVASIEKTIDILKSATSTNGTLPDHKGVSISLASNKVKYIQSVNGEMSCTTTDLNPENLLTEIDNALDWVITQQLTQQSVQSQNTGT
jgi:hypothetical protein